jgi:HEAT repeat protein
LSLIPHLQLGAGWRLDIISALIGLVLGILLTAGIRRLWPTLRRWRQRGSGRMRKSLAWMRSGVEVRYQAETAEYVQSHHLGREWATLDQIFVPPRLLIQTREIDPTPSSDWGACQLDYLWPDLAAGVAVPTSPNIGLPELLLTGRRTIVTAAGGSGKTTLLAYCAYQCATATAEGLYADLYPVVPVFFHLAELSLPALVDHDAEDAKEPEDPVNPLTTALQKRCSPLTSPGIKGMLRRNLKAGQLLLLLDGWDELPFEQRPATLDWLTRLLARFPNMQVIIAAPLTGYGPLLELDFTITGLIPWHAAQVESFSTLWTKAYPLSQSPHQSYFWRPGQSSLENSLRFWLLAASQESDGQELERPQRWTDLFKESLVLFNGSANQKGDDESSSEPTPPDAITLDYWQRLAGALVLEGKLSLTQAETGALIGETLAAHDAVERGVSSRLQKSVAGSRLFISWSNGSVGFMCTAWRDYLAAAHMAEHDLIDAAISNVPDPQWAEILRCYVSLAGATELATPLLASKEQSITRDTLFQVASWMAEAPDGGEWRRQAMILLGQMIRQGTFTYALRQRAVAALAQTSEQGVLTFLSQLLERSDPFLRHMGTTALSHLGTEKAIELLTGMLEDGDSRVRQTAVYALARLPHDLVERSMLIALVNGDDEMSRIAAEGLARSGSEGKEILKEAIEDEDLRVRRAAIHGLALLEEEWVVPMLEDQERIDNEWLVKVAAAEAVEKINSRKKPSPWQPLPLGEQPWLVKHAAEEGRIVPKGAAALPFLVQILTESSWPKLRLAAAASLGQIPTQDALPALETAVRDPDKQVSEAAFITLCQIRRAYDNPAPTNQDS